MIARYTGATLALFAFAVAIVAGLFAHNSPTTILSRAVLALFAFLGIGLVLGACAQMVIREHERKRDEEIRTRFAETPSASTDGSDGGGEVSESGPPVRA